MALPNKPSIKNVWATSGVKVEPSDTKVNTGWIVERPPHQFQNFLQNRSDQFLKHINEAGIPLWDAVTVYTAGKSYAQGSDGKIYKCLVDGFNENPVGNPTKWVMTFGDLDVLEYANQASDSAIAAANSASGAATSATTAVNTLAVFDDTPPASPFGGRHWTDSNTGKTYEWIIDADSGQWVEVGNPTAVAATAFAEYLGTVNGASLIGTPEGTVQEVLDNIGLTGAVKTVDLAASTGATLVGTPTGTVQAALDARPTSVTLAAPSGSALVWFQQNGAGAFSRSVESKLRDTVSVLDFSGVTADGIADDTAGIAAANAVSLDLTFPPGRTYNILNWEPRAGTRIHAHGATIRRPANTVFGATGSSASLVVTNNNIQVEGGKWDAFIGGASNPWTGSIVVNGGDNFQITGAEIANSWGGIFGHELQNGSLVSTNFSITRCWIHDCSHNTYLADIDGLMFNINWSELSSRDGLRTYRNCSNIEVVGNVICNNGDGTVGQSQDAIDVYIAGKRCLIANNFLYGNSVRGIDAKRITTDAEVNFDTDYLITGNFCFDNGDMGITIDGQDATVPIGHVLVTGNHVFNNGQFGVLLENCSKSIVTNNIVYTNGLDGIRNNACVDTIIANNNVYNNGTAVNVGNQNGIISASGSTGTLITGNIVRAGGATQLTGIFTDNGRCFNNDSTGHTADYSSTGNMSVLGKRILGKFTNNTSTQLLSMAERGQVCGLRTLINNTATSIDIIMQKRNATTGAASGTLSTETGVAMTTAWVPTNRSLSASGSVRSLAGGEALTITLSNITSAFTDGVVEIHYID